MFNIQSHYESFDTGNKVQNKTWAFIFHFNELRKLQNCKADMLLKNDITNISETHVYEPEIYPQIYQVKLCTCRIAICPSVQTRLHVK